MADLSVETIGIVNKEEGPPVPVSASDILSSLHGRQRRTERSISKAEFNAAVQFGERSRGFDNPKTGEKAWVFTYKAGGIAVVTNDSCTKEITSWALPCWGIDIEKVQITEDMLKSHNEAVKQSVQHDRWTSHTVAVIDQSGSMRKTDATNGVTRSDLVWLCLAVDYVGKRLKSGEATSQDYFSLIELSSAGERLITHHPMNWILYNKIIDMLRNRSPVGDGNYLPAIKLAEEALLLNKNGNCMLQLLFLTDGAPSDRPPRGFGRGMQGGVHVSPYHEQAIGSSIAFLARQFGSRLSVGAFAVGQNQFRTLQSIARTAQEYNCKVFLSRATLCVKDLSTAFMTMTSLLTATKTAATDVITNRQRTFRDIIREPRSSVKFYDMGDGHWTFYSSIDVTRAVFDKYAYEWVYPRYTFNHPQTVRIAVRDHIFGEGNERAVRRVREITSDGCVVGPALVGKESLFVEDSNDSKSFHKTFCKVQQLSQRMAAKFNKILVGLPGVERSSTPLISFLDCYVLLLNGAFGSGRGILVEKMLDPTKYKKWNTNDGYVDGMSAADYRLVKNKKVFMQRRDEREFTEQDCSFSIDDIPQAFSHFTYIFSKRKYLVCDLQGVLSTESNEPLFELTDPVIHYSTMTDRGAYGRTDRGQQGIDDFFRSHKCSNLCHMLLRRWIPDPLDKQITHYENVPISEPIPSIASESEDEEELPKESKRVKTVRFVL
eukprot:CCRYP_015930-RE/>CCRYP_015930-RE protein AED:0.28 eAED:0.28 QI:0/-1/0/1/-1/1/1/0/715